MIGLRNKKKRFGSSLIVWCIRLLVLAVVTWSFVLGHEWTYWVLKPQLGAALARLFAWVFIAGFAVAGQLLLAWIFGRFYCSFCCPLGIFQQILDWVWRRFKPGIAPRNISKLRYWLLGLSLLGLSAGYAVIWGRLEPLSLWGTILNSGLGQWLRQLYNLQVPALEQLPVTEPGTRAVTMGMMIIVLFAIITFFIRRFFCTNICPTGALLGLAAKCGVWNLTIDTDKCLKCGRCQKRCPAGAVCLDEFKINNELCLRCLSCVTDCPTGAIIWTQNKPQISKGQVADTPCDKRRRSLLIVSAAGIAAISLSRWWGFRKTASCSGACAVPEEAGKVLNGICPPGFGTQERFRNLCTSCGRCVINCRGKALQMPDGESSMVHLNFEDGMCEFNCNKCGTVCPTGALSALDLTAKKRYRIGVAEFHSYRCVAVLDGTDCGACAEHCPTGALRMKPDERGVRVPELDTNVCIGCGNCVYPCPVRPERAVVVNPVRFAETVPSPEEYFKSSSVEAIEETGNNDEWLI